MKIINAIAVAALRPIDRLTCTDVRALYKTTTSWQIYLLWEILTSGVTLVQELAKQLVKVCSKKSILYSVALSFLDENLIGIGLMIIFAFKLIPHETLVI